jgi:hypothetical protein
MGRHPKSFINPEILEVSVCHEHRESTAMRNCTRDGGRPSGFGDQELNPSHRKLLRTKAVVVSVAVKSGSEPRRARSREASASEPLQKRRNELDDVKTGGCSLFRDRRGGGPETAHAASGV